LSYTEGVTSEVVTQFRAISLCNINYKIVGKVLVERLKACIPLLISPYQTRFVPGRNIHEYIVLVKEMIHTMNQMRGYILSLLKLIFPGLMINLAGTSFGKL
jgi:hypothetical protein